MSCSFNYEGAILLIIQYLGTVYPQSFYNHPVMIQHLTTLCLTPMNRIVDPKLSAF